MWRHMFIWRILGLSLDKRLNKWKLLENKINMLWPHLQWHNLLLCIILNYFIHMCVLCTHSYECGRSLLNDSNSVVPTSNSTIVFVTFLYIEHVFLCRLYFKFLAQYLLLLISSRQRSERNNLYHPFNRNGRILYRFQQFHKWSLIFISYPEADNFLFPLTLNMEWHAYANNCTTEATITWTAKEVFGNLFLLLIISSYSIF